jgi:small subunit ribosomal protein S20
MPNLKAAKKSLRADAKKRVHNLRRKREMKDIEKEVRTLASKGENSPEALSKAFKAIDKAAKNGVIKKNTAARKKSRLSKALAKNAK